MKVDLSCPIELRSYELMTDDAGRVRASISLYNLTKRRISDFEAVAHWTNSKTGASAAAPFQAGGLRAAPRGFFNISLSSDAARHADQLELNFTRVRFSDGEREWRAGNGVIVDIAETKPLSGAEQNALFAAAGEDAVRFPEENASTWSCVCGRVNPQGKARCARCRRHYAEVFPALLRDQVLKGGARAEMVMDLDDMPLEERRMRRIQEERLHREYLKKRSALIRRTIATLGVAAVLAIIVYLQGI